MPIYEIELNGVRSTKKVLGKLTLTVEAANIDEANDIIKDSLPGFDWGSWTSFYGAREKQPLVPS